MNIRHLHKPATKHISGIITIYAKSQHSHSKEDEKIFILEPTISDFDKRTCSNLETLS